MTRDFEPISSVSPIEYLAAEIQKNNYKVIALFGPSCGGKTTAARNLLYYFGEDKSVLVSVDDYWCYSRDEMKQKKLTGYDWEARNKKLFLQDLENLKNNAPIHKPLMDDMYERPAHRTEYVAPKDIIILEATLDFTGIADLLIFMYAPDEIIFERRMKRDSDKKGFASREELASYVLNKSIPAYREKLLPLSKDAHFIFDSSKQMLYKNKKSLRILGFSVP